MRFASFVVARILLYIIKEREREREREFRKVSYYSSARTEVTAFGGLLLLPLKNEKTTHGSSAKRDLIIIIIIITRFKTHTKPNEKATTTTKKEKRVKRTNASNAPSRTRPLSARSTPPLTSPPRFAAVLSSSFVCCWCSRSSFFSLCTESLSLSLCVFVVCRRMRGKVLLFFSFFFFFFLCKF